MKEKEYTVSTTEYEINDEKNNNINVTASFRKENSHSRKRKLQALAITIASVVAIGNAIPKEEKTANRFAASTLPDCYTVGVIPEDGLIDLQLLKTKYVTSDEEDFEDLSGYEALNSTQFGGVGLTPGISSRLYIYDADGDLLYVLKVKDGEEVSSEVLTTKYKTKEVLLEKGALLFVYTKEAPIIELETVDTFDYWGTDNSPQTGKTYYFIGKNVEAKFSGDTYGYFETFVYK